MDSPHNEIHTELWRTRTRGRSGKKASDNYVRLEKDSQRDFTDLVHKILMPIRISESPTN